MKIILKNTALIFGFVIAFSVSAFAQGREVTIFLKDGTQKFGELLSVRDSVISVLKNSVENDEEIGSYPEVVDIALLKDIDRVRLEEYDVSGAGKGALIGAGIVGVGSVVVGTNSEYGQPQGSTIAGTAVGGALVGALYGSIIGWAVGMIMSEDAEIVLPSVTKGFRHIREHARFDGREPSYVRDTIDNLLKAQK